MTTVSYSYDIWYVIMPPVTTQCSPRLFHCHICIMICLPTLSYSGRSLCTWPRRLFDLKPYASYILIYAHIYAHIYVLHFLNMLMRPPNLYDIWSTTNVNHLISVNGIGSLPTLAEMPAFCHLHIKTLCSPVLRIKAWEIEWLYTFLLHHTLGEKNMCPQRCHEMMGWYGKGGPVVGDSGDCAS